MNKVFLIGIGGSGLSAIARLLIESGYEVKGSDLVASSITSELSQLGATIFIGHRAEQVLGSDLVIRSSAIPEDNPELLAARRNGIQIQKRSEFLETFLEDKFTIAVAGTHGKTTTTAMIAWLLSAMGMKPGYLIGGLSRNLKNNAHAGESQYFVIEADEYDRMFLGLRPDLAVINNIEHDHPDLFPTKGDYENVFIQFLQRLQPEANLLFGEHVPSNIVRVAASKGFLTHFGFGSKVDYQAREASLQPDGCYRFELLRTKDNTTLAHVKLIVPGRHNVMNALAALAVIDLLDLPVSEAAQHMAQYSGVERRFEIKAEFNGITLIDDYAHHPTEIRSTLQAAREMYPQGRIIAVWQPHTFTRSKTLFDEFTKAFEDADEVLITEVYAARETDPTFSASKLAANIHAKPSAFFANLHDLVEEVKSKLKQNDVLIVLSAGDAISINEQIRQHFQRIDKRSPDSQLQQEKDERAGS